MHPFYLGENAKQHWQQRHKTWLSYKLGQQAAGRGAKTGGSFTADTVTSAAKSASWR